MISHGREQNGRFARGNSGGPGRPRRAIESEYLAVLSDTVQLDDWREIVARAAADAKAGDASARAWLAKYLLGEKPRSLLELAADELVGRTVTHQIQVRAQTAGREFRLEGLAMQQKQ